MFAATSNNPDFYPYQAEVGAVGVYKDAKTGTYVAALTNSTKLSDGAWGNEGFSTISSLYEADAAQAFEYRLWPSFPYKSSFQAKLAEYLAQEYMNYINSQNLVVNGKKLTIQYDVKKYPDTNGYYGTYLDYMLDQFHKDLEWYLNNLKWSSSWTKDDPKMSDAEAFLKGSYSYQETGRGGGGPPLPVVALTVQADLLPVVLTVQVVLMVQVAQAVLAVVLPAVELRPLHTAKT